MAQPWTRAKQIARALRGEVEFPEGYKGSRTLAELTALFDACFRIQREASEAAGHRIPLVVENVKGAQPWVGRARWSFGSFMLWGDVPALMPMTLRAATKTVGHANKRDGHTHTRHLTNQRESDGLKVSGLNWSKHGQPGYKPKGFNVTNAQRYRDDVKGLGLGSTSCGQGAGNRHPNDPRNLWSGSDSRKAASAMIAKIPLPLSRWIAKSYRPTATYKP